MTTLLFSAVLLAASAQMGERRTDHLHYSLNGLMSGPTELDLSLDTGVFVLREGASAKLRAERERRGHLDSAAVSRIRMLAGAAIAKGVTRRACRRAAARGEILMPIMDAIPEMTIKLGTRNASAPTRADCWSDAADKLIGAALDSVHQATD